MAVTGFIHHIGTFLLFASTVLLLITTISAPVVNSISLMKVSLANDSTVEFGTFGYCIKDVPSGDGNEDHRTDWCTGKHIGYSPAEVMLQINGNGVNRAGIDTSKALTRVMILHPILTGVAFIAFLLALGAGVVGGLLASLTAALTWALTVVVLATDLTCFGIVKNHVNDHDKVTDGSKAEFSVALWTEVVAMVCLFFATFIVLFSCCSARRHKRDARNVKHTEAAYGTPVARRRFWQRRSRY